ncbi:hypothetical protein [Archangium sp.]|uniref:hypothetical protein n=1 Tax=Archangium sp. TaxID=1872627 RepID=UPI00286C9DB3|nr:hypothetical protein [Archangium sp.]
MSSSGQLARSRAPSLRHLLAGLLPLLVGCSINHYQPRHFEFVTVVKKTKSVPGGWRAACLQVPIVNTATWDTFYCQFGVEMPLETQEVGSISTALAQRIAADCANEAAKIVLDFPSSPRPGLLCQDFKSTFHTTLNRAVLGSRVTTQCHRKTTPHVIEF